MIPAKPAAALLEPATRLSKADAYKDLVIIKQNYHDNHLDKFIWCKHCSTQGWNIAVQDRNTSNYTKHFKKYHASVVSATPPANQQKVNTMWKQQEEKVEPYSDKIVSEIDRLMGLVWIDNCWSFNSVESNAFIQLVHALSGGKYIPPGRTKLTQIIDAISEDMDGTMVELIKDCPVSITTDGGTMQNGVGFQAVTASIVTPDFKAHDIALTVEPTGGSQTAPHVSGILDNVLDRFKFGSRQCLAACTDNCSAVVKSVKMNDKIEHSLTCICHTLNLALQDIANPKIKKVKPPSSNAALDADISTSEDSESEQEDSAGDVPAPPSVINAPNAFQLLLLKARRLIAKLSRSVKLNEAFKTIQQSLIQEQKTARTKVYELITFIETRFVAQYFVFDRLLLLRDAVDIFVTRHGKGKKVKLQAFSNEEWQLMDEYHKILFLFHTTSSKFEASRGSPLGFVGAELALMLDGLHHLSLSFRCNDASNFCKDVSSRLRVRLATMMNLKMYQIGFALDPRAFRKQIPGWNTVGCHNALISAFYQFDMNNYVESKSPEVEEVQAPSPASAPASAPVAAQNDSGAGASVLGKRKLSKLPDIAIQPLHKLSEVQLYLRQPSFSFEGDPLDWWKEKAGEFPILSQMARVYLSLPCSSASSERVFSAARLQLDYKRMRLDPYRISRLVCLNRNFELYIRLIMGDEAWDNPKARWVTHKGWSLRAKAATSNTVSSVR